MKQDIIIFIGPPGAGKGTLSTLCVQRWGWKQISTGNLCRRHIIEQTKIGQEIDFAIKHGKLVSDDLITNMVEEAISELRNGTPFILDGYPRTVAQAKQLYDVIQGDRSLNVLIVHFKVSPEIVISRLSNRYICQNKDCQMVYSLAASHLAPKCDMICDRCKSPVGRRHDDEEKSIVERLRIYYEHEDSLLAEFRRTRFPIVQVAADQQPDQMFNNFVEQFNCIGQ